MSCCCASIYQFCRPISHCSAADFGSLFTALPNGTYNVNLQYLESTSVIEITVLDTVVTTPEDMPQLNENYTYTGRVYSVDGVVIPMLVEGVPYDCFNFTTN